MTLLFRVAMRLIRRSLLPVVGSLSFIEIFALVVIAIALSFSVGRSSGLSEGVAIGNSFLGCK